MSQQAIGPVLQRYELKFLIDSSLIEPISQFASIYCSMDKFSQISDDYFYIVNSLYFDSPNYNFLKRRLANEDNRFNMRVRCYSYERDQPQFLEIKFKSGSILRKLRGKVCSKDYPIILEKGIFLPDEGLDAKENKSINTFIRLAITYDAKPKVLVQYRRKAYISDCDEYARVTFDRNLCYKAQSGYSSIPVPGELVHCDHEMMFPGGGNVILELKCYTSQVPLWMLDLIRTFNLNRCSFSKYVTGMREISDHNRYDTGIRQSILNCH